MTNLSRIVGVGVLFCLFIVLPFQAAWAQDTDKDGIPDAIEATTCTDPNNPDTDGDMLCDGGNSVFGVCWAGEDWNNNLSLIHI